MRQSRPLALIIPPSIVIILLSLTSLSGGSGGQDRFDGVIRDSARDLMAEGRRTFRHETFGNEAVWGGTLRLHEAIAGTAFGGVASPDVGLDGVGLGAALAVGLKVDVEAVPHAIRTALNDGTLDFVSSGPLLELLRHRAVIGLAGFFRPDGTMVSIGIQCALCHSTVDDALAPGIGHRRDGWANRDLNVGLLLHLAPDLGPVVDLLNLSGTPFTVSSLKAVLRTWGPGKFDPELFLDGKAINPQTGRNGAVLIPPAFGLAGVNLTTWTGWGSITHWNALVATVLFHGQGTFFDPRLDDAERFPIAAAVRLGHVRSTPDRMTPKLAALQFYQLAIPAPTPPRGSFDEEAAKRGQMLFAGKGRCASCHVPPLFTEPGWNMHTPEEMALDPFQADRAPDRRYRTSPLRGLWTHTKGGFFHDGRFPTLAAVIDHYDRNGIRNRGVPLNLSPQEKTDLIEYLKSL
jgi:hypothetical protein